MIVYPMGARLFPFVIEPSTIITSTKSLGEQHIIWESITGVPILNYKTLYGDFYVDLGRIFRLLLFCIFFNLKEFYLSRKSEICSLSCPLLLYSLGIYGTIVV